ncbi:MULTISPECIES: SF1B family DNA helicase RecD2 [Streptomyces]|jgi:exodeoxyribonuclease V alpha subunit|uniref:ATP-dependent RecD2 DNA helicase n=2 Tax=Streptomyces mirabilis TaxID=68239 RepID=A0ABU3UTF7_9ACTN|nr:MULTISPECIES: ATP-dependent RecD-like DNA helicase [Streptomyces]MCX4608957.1 ATP-dependent RecD-like DNA helicase [Streptomyces mirabilis]MDU8997210.1 ATP-dependent RecD-like DNA helicase [Streptomyces mirabilis]NMI58468.1 ATP-dependent RecD-like DNA helicase [Streptomyces sp. RLA2-12]QDN57803.1 ATP-dependent RecD-like DNA helicase [Streptomyces sp. S1D4-20]QDN67900.1 ATP-dependent RecD-like DNA helicase [Streptomyces sp. S1D4-14]
MSNQAENRQVQLAVVEGVLERITYANEENGYTVARVDTGRGAGDLLTVVGALLGAQVGESLRMEGRWGSHPQYGKQFTVENYTTVLPATVQGIRRYLGSGLVKGIGPIFADRITQHFGLDTLQIIEEEPKRLIEVPGLGPKRTKKIADAWEEQKAIKEVMLFLQTVEVSTSIAVRIYKKYGDASISVVKNQPYRLAADVWGIGFLTADKIAQSVGIPHDSPERVKAGLQYALSQSADQGHCFLPEEQLIADAVKLLQVDTGLVIECLAELAEPTQDEDEPGGVREPGVVREKVPGPDGGPDTVTAVYLVPFHRAELSLSAQLLRLLRTTEDRMPGFHDVAWDKALTWLKGRTGAELAPGQEEAVRLALTKKVAVLTGGPGCGKSFTVRSIVELARAKRAKVVLAAPTGRAAKRLAELTGADASTVHRLLELKPGGDAAYDKDRPLDADLVVVDEASMLDLLLANKLVKAVPPGAHLLFVGDVDQLPSVGAGEVLRDLLADRSPIPSVRLTQVFRQAQQSGVVTNAHRINSGQHPVTDGMKDFFLFVEDETEEAGRLTVDVAARRIPARFGLDPRRDIQVLAPMHRGPAGAGTLNGLLQQAITPGRPDLPEKRFGGRVFRVGDKVTQIRNNYEKGENGVFNGTVGVVTSLDSEEQRLTVLTDEDEEVPYDFDELDELAHAYAVTIHRSQGSEYPAVVIPVTTGAWMMLQRNLLYTAVTRAKKLVVLVGSRKAIGQAVRTVSAGRRHTSLDHRLTT